MSIIKPLEQNTDKLALLKVAFLVTLVATGVLLDKVFFKKSQEIPSILGKSQEIKLPSQKEITKQIQENSLVKDSLKKAEDLGGVVLGEATDTLTKLTSDAGSLVSNVIYDNSIGKLADQVSKLPKDQQERIKAQICK